MLKKFDDFQMSEVLGRSGNFWLSENLNFLKDIFAEEYFSYKKFVLEVPALSGLTRRPPRTLTHPVAAIPELDVTVRF